MMKIWIKLKKFDLKIKEILKNQYVGTYLHGSLAMGCFHPEKSDIDCLCVVHHDLTMDQKEKLMKVIFELHQCIPNGLEISVIKRNIAKILYTQLLMNYIFLRCMHLNICIIQ